MPVRGLYTLRRRLMTLMLERAGCSRLLIERGWSGAGALRALIPGKPEIGAAVQFGGSLELNAREWDEARRRLACLVDSR